MTNMNNIIDSVVRQSKSVLGARTFPIGDVIEEVLREKDIAYETFSIGRGFDVRLMGSYSIKLPAVRKKAKGVKGIFGRIDLEPTITLEEITSEIDKRYFSKFEPKLLQNKPDLAKPSILTSSYARYLVSPPSSEPTDCAFIDVANIKVKGYQNTD